MVNSCLFSTFCFHFRILKKREEKGGGGGALIVMVLSEKKVDRLLSESNKKKKQDLRILENHNRFQPFSSFFFSFLLS